MMRADREPAREGELPRTPFLSKGPAGDEDSYEAALRAADALFSGGPAVPSAMSAETARLSSGGSKSDPTVDSVFASPSRYQVDDASASRHDQAAQQDQVPRQDNVAAATGGRILRAIDEPVADPFAGYPAERTPQRRGRKPGSKNKPKLVPSATPVDKGFEGALGTAPRPALRPSPVRTPEIAALHAVSHGAALPTMPRARREPFGWVRTKLRPGERWKRRLPKVAW